MADEGQAPPPADAAPEEAPPAETEPPPAEAEPPPEEAPPADAAPPPAEGEPPPEEAPSADAGPPPEEGAPPPAEEAPPPAEDVPPPAAGEGEGERAAEGVATSVQFGEVGEDEAGRERVSEAKSLEKVDEEPDSALSIDLDKLDSLLAIEAKEVAVDKKRTEKALGSTISVRRGAQEMLERSKVAKFMNSYKLESDKPFNTEKVETILHDVLAELITDDLMYDADHAMKQAKWASGTIRDKIKEQEYDRYKIVCIVTIGEKRYQDVYSLFRFLWDAERDKFATYTLENMRLFAVAVCFGMYYE